MALETEGVSYTPILDLLKVFTMSLGLEAAHVKETTGTKPCASGVRSKRNPVPSPKFSTNQHIPTLEGIRGVAILLVLSFHLNLLRSFPSDSPVDTLFAEVLAFGWCGVDLFFVLSGYLITRILYLAKGSEEYFAPFYTNRVLRIFPLYYALLIITFIVIPHLPTGLIPAEKLERWAQVDANPLWYWLYLNNFTTALAGSWGHGILDVTWSLAIEEQFYLLWPWVVYTFNRERLLRICLGIFFTAFIIRTAMTLADMNAISIYVFTPGRLDVLAAGAFVALAGVGSSGIRGLLPARKIFIITGVVCLSLALWRGGAYNMDPVILTVGLSFVAIHFAAFIAVVRTLPSEHWLAKLLSSKLLRAFGKYSFAIYLVHMPLSALIRDTLYHPHQFMMLWGSKLPGQILFYVGTISLTFIVAFLSWHFWEKHFLKLKKSFVLPSDMTSPDISTQRT
jgi:peptidoglycan/LPS O-acetylase OafA/YrhL